MVRQPGQPGSLPPSSAATRADRVGRGTRPSGGGRVVARRSSHRPGNAVDMLIDGAQALPAIVGRCSAPLARSSDRLVSSRPIVRARRARASRSSCATSSPNWPSDSTCGCSPGRARRCRSSAPRGRTCGRCATQLTAAHEDPLRARRERAADALPSREDDRHRRPHRVRRRHRPHLEVGRPLRHERPSCARRASAGTTAARASKGRRWPTSASTSACAGTRSPASDWPPPSPAEPAGDVELQVVRTVPERIYGAKPRGEFTHPRVVRSRSPSLRSGSSTSRTSSSGHPRSRPCCTRRSPIRLTTTSALAARAPGEAEQRRRRHARRARAS